MKKTVFLFLFLILMLSSSCASPVNKGSAQDNDSFSVASITKESYPQAAETKETTSAATAENVTERLTTPAAKSVSSGTYTGRVPLACIDFIFESLNTKNLPKNKICHNFGAAANEKPHSITLSNQKFFDGKGFNAVAYDNKSDGKPLYLTFDCGYENGYTSKILDILKEKGVKAAFFCTLTQMKSQPQLIARMINEGHTVGNHTNKHPSYAKISRTRMAQEIKDFDDYLRLNFGYTSPFFRFPYGEYTEESLELVNSLGYKCVFWSLSYEDWDINNQKGKENAVKTVSARLHPGAVILLHSVSSDNAAALDDIIDYARSKGYVFKELSRLGNH